MKEFVFMVFDIFCVWWFLICYMVIWDYEKVNYFVLVYIFGKFEIFCNLLIKKKSNNRKNKMVLYMKCIYYIEKKYYY